MTKIRKYAKGKECQVRIPHVCNGNPETSVLAHLNGAGMGIKHNDLFGTIACYKCHMAIDGHLKTDYTHEELRLMFFEGMVRTQKLLIEGGIISPS